jgi:hypothetical protein
MPYALDVGVYGVVNFKIFEGRDQTIRQDMENLRQPEYGFLGTCVHHRVHILLSEGNPISLIFQNIDPPSPSPPGECVIPPKQRGGGG